MPSDYYSSRYEDPPSRFPSASDPQRPSQYPTSIKTSNLTTREYSARPSNAQSNYTITRGNTKDTYVYEQSEVYSTSEYDDTATNESYSPTSPAMSTDSLMTLKSPLPSPLTEEDSMTSTRHNSMSIPAPPLPTGPTTGRSYPSSHEDVLRSGDETHLRPNSIQGHSTTTSTSPPSTFATDTRPSSTNTTSYTTPAPPAAVPVPPASATSSGGYTWHHAIPTIPPSEADTEDVSLEARMNAEFNAVSTGSLYTSPSTDNADPSRGPVPISIPVPSVRERSSPPYASSVSSGAGRLENGRLHVTVPGAVVTTVSDDLSSAREPLTLIARSPASSTVVESLEEGRAPSYMHHRNSTVVLGERDQFLPPFADDRWVNDQERERYSSVSYQRVPIPAPVPELRREYSTGTTSRSVASSTNATYHSSPPRTSNVEERPPPVPLTPTPTSRPRRDSRTGYSAPPPRPEVTRRSSDGRDSSPPSRPSPPRQEETKLDTSPRRRTESALGLHIPEPTSSSRAGGAYAPPSIRSDVQQPPHPSSRVDRRSSPPTAFSGNTYRSQSVTPPEPSHRYTSDSSRTRPQSNSPPESYRKPAALQSDDSYRTTHSTSDPYRSQSGVPYRPQSTVPSSIPYRTTTSTDPYRPQSTAPPESSYRSSFSTRQPPAAYTDPGYLPQMTTMIPSSSPSHPITQNDTRPPATRSRTNSGSWSRNATAGSTPASSKPPSPPSRHAQTPAPRSSSRPTSPISHEAPPSSRVPTTPREANSHRDQRAPQSAYSSTAAQPVGVPARDIQGQRDQRGSPPSYTAAVTSSSPKEAYSSSPPRDVRSSLKHRDGSDDSDYSVEKPNPKTKSVLTVRNPSPSETSTERSSSPPRTQQSTTVSQPGRRQSDAAERQSQNKTPFPTPPYTASTTPTTATASARRSTLPYDARTNGQVSINDYGRPTTHVPFAPERPQRRFSVSEQADGPSFSMNTTGRASGPLARCVRWNENLICPSPVFPNRRKGWFNRRG